MEEEGAETRIQGELEQNDEVDEDHCREVVTEGRKLDAADAPLCHLPPGRRRDARSSERSNAAYRLMVVFYTVKMNNQNQFTQYRTRSLPIFL